MNIIEFGDCRETMRRWAMFGFRVQACVTSPPYFGLRDYGHSGQLGLEKTPDEYVANMVEVFRCVRDLLADDGCLFLNLGDSYFSDTKGSGGPSDKQDSNAGSRYATRKFERTDGLKPKDLIGIPWRVAFALQADGWYLRQDIIWHKPNPMPESVTDRCTKAHEYLFMLTKRKRYYYDSDAMQEPAIHAGKTVKLGEKSLSKGQATGANVARSGNANNDSVMVKNTRNRRSVWTIATRPYKGAHFATFPETLVEPCVLAGSRPGDIVMDPFMGSGTTAAVAVKHGRQYLGCELNPEYEALQQERLGPSC